ncbi:MAG TPA: AAA family ATPase, partial [Streptosporangiaceae bacterium]|nr:AAA family ATPase [Streptosporangiaceae bacterium]
MSRADRLIGRESALAAASSVLDDARRGAGQFLMISGEAGIGKTAMLAALVSRSGPAPLVLRGFCWEGDGAPPYWPWSQVLQASGLPMADLGEAGWLLQPASGPAEPMDAVAAGDAQFRLFQAVARCLGRLAAGSGSRPVLVVFDDLHWADEPSLRLLGFLARALAAESVALLGAYRDTEASPQLLKIAGQAQQLALAGLTPDEVEALARELAGTALPAQVTAELWRRSGGNPFFVRELIRLLQAQGSWHQPVQIPASVAETLRRRLARLSTECVRLLERAAIAGRDVDVALLAHGAAVGHELATLSLLDEGRRAGVIAGTSPPRFTHDLYRETILDGLSTSARTAIHLSVGRALQARAGPAARVAAHLLAAGPSARQDALEYSLLAAREATARLGHEDACEHYLRALHVISERGAVTAERVEILLELAASHERTGRSDLAAERYREAADVSRMAADAMGLARAALGIQTLGCRSGAQNAELLELLREASRRLEAAGGPVALQSRVLAALARTLRHGTGQRPGAEIIGVADEAVRLAAAAGDASALATAKLAVHDAMWVAGTAARRLPVIAEILDAAQASGDDDLAAEAHLLRAAALLELGDPAGRDELLGYITLAGNLGHARGRWGALTRQATFAQLAGRAEEAARLGEQALELGLAIGEPDAVGCFSTARAALTVFGISAPPMELDAADPLWPMLPVFKAWPFAARGEAAAAAAALGDFSVLDITMWTGLEALAAAAVVFAAAGSDAQRTWVYERLRPYAGSHVVVGGCASYHAAV